LKCGFNIPFACSQLKEEEPNIHSKLLEEEQALERRIQQLTADWKAKRPTGAGNVPFRAISSIEWI